MSMHPKIIKFGLQTFICPKKKSHLIQPPIEQQIIYEPKQQKTYVWVVFLDV
jgi:hypothetical protein